MKDDSSQGKTSRKIEFLIADDSRFICSTVKNTIEQLVSNYDIHIVHTLHEILPTLNNFRIDILILDLHFPSGTSFDLISEIVKRYPHLYLCAMSAQSDIRKALDALNDGSDYYLVKDSRLNSDLNNAVNTAVSSVNKNREYKNMIDAVFDKNKYPMVVMKASEMGSTVIYKDFENFPEDIGDFEKFIGRINISLLVALGQGETYHTGIFQLPAANSKFYTVLNYAFRLPDPAAIDKRLSMGYFHCLLFTPNSFESLIPSLSELKEISTGLDDMFSNAEDLTPENLNLLKEAIFNRVKNHKLYP